jgi:hypothetical protein
MIRYTPYFFDKALLDNILEASMDQHFNSITQNRHTQRRRDIFDDSLTSEIIEESTDSLLELPEVLIDHLMHIGCLESCLSALEVFVKYVDLGTIIDE